MEREQTLASIAEEISSCTRCPLAGGRLHAVPGSGTGKKRIVFIGEGPGAQEDKKGVPFVGASGKFLDDMFASIGMTRDDVFITNVVKCRPPENRDPRDEEVAVCVDTFLWRQLEAIDPLLIVTLGRHAMYRFIPKDKAISNVHGMVFKLTSPRTGKHFNILPLYHPAAALYNGSMRTTLLADFEHIPKVLKELEK